jgi:phosphatidylglycerophosphate synthase
MRAVQAFPATGLIAQVSLVAALGATVGLSDAGWVLGIACGVITSTMLARSLSRYHSHRLSPADWVTLARATLAVGVAALVADSFGRPARVTMLVTLAAAALALDAVDGWLARRSGTASKLGARFDGEVDAFLILALSVYVARSTGAWVLAIGAARYVFLAAGWLLPWLREPLPPRYWRKVVCATQGIVLTVTAADVLPSALTQAALVVALALLAESFGRDVWWLWTHRHATDSCGGLAVAVAADAGASRGRVRTIGAAVLTAASALLVWVALVVPDHPSLLTPGSFARIPLEGVVVIALALALPAVARRILAWVVGAALGLLLLVRLLDLGLLTIFDRRFDPVSDWRYTGIVIENLSDSIGRTKAIPPWSPRCCSSSPCSRSRPWRCGGWPGSRTLVAGGRSRPSRRSVSPGCSAGRSARSSPPAFPWPRRAPPAWPPTRCVRSEPASRIVRSSPPRSAATPSATPPVSGC